MDVKPPRGLLDCFADLEDPRIDRTRLHRLDDMVAIAILAVICAAETWVDVAEYGEANEAWLKTFLHLPHGIPSHDTFGRVFAALDPESFEQCFMAWVQGLLESTQQHALHIDGKTLRRSFDGASDKAAIHRVSVWAAKAQMAMAQVSTDAKSNEITAIPRLLDLITLNGAVVTIDAMGCQREIAKQIIDGGGDYLLAVKDNHPTLHGEIKLLFDEAIPNQFEAMGYGFHETVEKGHGRIETRRVWVTREVGWLRARGEWAGLRSVVRVESLRETLDTKTGKWKKSRELRHYLTSLDHRDPGRHACDLNRLIRSHWGIENQLHWSLDVSFSEDACRVREGYGAENFSRLRRIALNLLKNEKSAKRGIQGKRLKAAWDKEYLLKVLRVGN